MRIGYITCVIYNTPDNLRIALEDNLIENSGKNSENHKLRINTGRNCGVSYDGGHVTMGSYILASYSPMPFGSFKIFIRNYL